MVTAVKRVDEFFKKGLWDMDTGAPRSSRAVLIRLAKFVYLALREFTDGQLAFRAMSLVYTTLLSIVPLLAVSFSVLKAFGVHNKVQPLLAKFLAPLGPGGDEITQKIIGFVGNMKVGVLGSIGLAMLMYTVISVIYKMEDSLNYIWKVKRPRSFSRRFSDYMSVLLVGPILIFSAFGLTAAIKSNAFVQGLLSFGPAGFLFYALSLLLPYVTTCAAFTFAYIFIPSAKVHVRSALAGGVFAGVVWELSGWAFATFVASSAQYSAIYSGFAILILFMMWLYFSWLIFLVGGSVSFYYQHPRYLVLKKEDLVASGSLREKLALAVMFLIGDNFYRNKERWTLDSLGGRLKAPVEPLQETLKVLEDGGLVALAGDDEGRLYYLPARDIETITVGEVLEMARRAGAGSQAVEEKLQSPPRVDEITGKISSAVRDSVSKETIKGLVLSDKGGRK